MTDGYTEVYGSDEISEVVVDNIVAIVAALVSFASLIAVILLWRWVKGRKTM